MFFKPVLLTKSFDMTTLDIITIVLFSLGVVLVGLAFSQKGKSMQSFFAANGTMPWYMRPLTVYGIFLCRHIRRMGFYSLFYGLGFNHYPMDNGDRRLYCRITHRAKMA